jgi:hypothetical protein
MHMLNEAQNQFTMEISIDKTALGDPVIYVDGNRAGKTYTFGDFTSACDALEDWKQIAQVIIPTTGVWRHVAGFQTELKGRKDRKSEQTKLAQRLARIRAGIVLESRQRYRFEGKERERFNECLVETSRMTESALKAALKNEDMTLVAAHARAKGLTEAKAEQRAAYHQAKALEKPQVVLRATAEGKSQVHRAVVVEAIQAMGQTTVPKTVEHPVAVGS